MAFEITIPRLGWSMEEGTFVRWLKEDGDIVQPGDALFELEGEKAAQDVEAVDAGVLRIPPDAPQPGSIVAVGAVIGYLVAAGESVPVDSAKQTDRSQPTADQPLSVGVVSSPPAAPSIRRMARQLKVDLASVAGSGPAGRISADDVRNTQAAATSAASRATGSAAVASPRARRVAMELGVDWTVVAGTGRGGRIRERDVRAAASGNGSARSGRAVDQRQLGSSIPVSKHRKTIAERMLYSRLHTAPVTLTTKVDATNLVNLRQQFKSASGDAPVPSYSDVVAKLVAMSLARHPLLMAQWADDHLVVPDAISLGLAVDTDAGLLVPVIRNVPALTLVELSRQSQSLIARARAGQLKATDLQGAAFTITNLGAFGIDAFTPIINVPESAILGLGRIRREPAVVDNQVVPRDQMTLSLTFDHRIVDGAPAARFLQEVGQAIEAPSAWLLKKL